MQWKSYAKTAGVVLGTIAVYNRVKPSVPMLKSIVEGNGS